MNDEKEFKTGLDVIKSNSSLDGAFHKTTEFPLKKRFPYQLSLSLAEDSEHMWQNYGNSIGVMLILESRIITSLYPNTARCVHDNTIEFERIQQYVSSDKWLEQPEGLSKKVPISEEVWENLTMFVYLAKSYDYQEEEEVRIFGEESKNVITKGNGTFIEIHLPKEALKGIMIGPGSEYQYEAVKQRVFDLLSRKGYTHLKYEDITQSSKSRSSQKGDSPSV